MKVAIGCIVRNRAWALPRYLHALEQMRVPGERGYFFLENDSEDGTLPLLSEFTERTSAFARIASVKTGVEGWDHHQYDYENMANLRNRFLDWFLITDADFLLSVDSDIVVQPDTFENLYEAHQQTGGIVAAAICNIADRELDGFTPGNWMVRVDGALQHPVNYPMTGVQPVDLTGAVYLIPRWVIEAGARYGKHPQGEDVPFCESAHALGCAMHVNMDARCEHRMMRDTP